MLSTEQAQTLVSNGGDVVGSNQDTIGKISQLFLDDATGEPAWVTVKTGMFGGAESFVPLNDARLIGDDVSVPYTKSKVKDAPRVEDSDGYLNPDEENDLYRYYELEHSSADLAQTANPDREVESPTARGAGHDTSGPDTDSAMTRSEEQLHVGTQSETIGKARLRKYIVTENVTTTVPVSHEEVRIEREPITDANRDDAVSGGDITEEVHEVELKGERVVVTKDTVPVERVRLSTETVTEDQQVSEEVRKEQIDTEGGEIDSADRRDR
ncbi:DUF2382 domain-containing protein [Aeromicrobium wangtongii]|uniref:DUF2382 domain-containing protein n=1 Tax=Aeromicrobium wangtongii TaxID=2969247 RepID=UPI0020177ED5|nr:PRC and DUF2382 domain-containing protein [Aeromicrobium wangtongii]MCL3819366.1 PRC and DUF2382 domain-containing protein [Aeromicrobium wangtongii]